MNGHLIEKKWKEINLVYNALRIFFEKKEIKMNVETLVFSPFLWQWVGEDLGMAYSSFKWPLLHGNLVRWY